MLEKKLIAVFVGKISYRKIYFRTKNCGANFGEQ